MKNKIKFGWAEGSITPDKRVRLAGQFYDRISQEVESPVTATALAIVSGNEQTILCSVDETHIYGDLLESICKKINAIEPEIDTNKIVINATHTHNSLMYESNRELGLDALTQYLGLESAPMFGEGNVYTDNVMEPAEATEYLAERLADVIIEAWKAVKPAYFSCAFGRAAVGMNRRVCYTDGSAKMWGDAAQDNFKLLEGGNDNGIEMLFTYDTDKKPTGAILNIACPSQVMEQRYCISADYWGQVKIMLRKYFGEDFKVLALCAPAGDQCPRDLIRWIEPETPIEDPNVIRNNPPIRRADPSMYDVRGLHKIGRRISTEVIAVYEEDEQILCDEAEFGHIAVKMPLPLRRVTEEENTAARKALKEFADTHDNSKLDFNDTARMHVHAGIAERYDLQKEVSTVYADVHVIRIGDIAIASDPFELFLDFANVIRARSAAKQTFLVQLANDGMGYLPTEKAEQGGHYSAYVSSGCVGHEGGYILAENTLKMIDELFSK